MIRNTSLGTIKGLEEEHCYAYLGIPFARAGRFAYGSLVTHLGESFDATKPGPACIQKRCWYAHLEVPERMFYHKEFRDNIHFDYSEDCLNLNIYTPKEEGSYPVIVFIHGGGFDSGANSESGFDGDCLASRGIVTVFIQYRVGVFGYFTHADITRESGHEGNFGLDDQVLALKWVRKFISEFNGNKNNITVMGQSAGAMSIQSMILSKRCQGLFNKAVMMSGAGKFPSMGTPKPVEERREYWLDVMKTCHCSTLEEFREIPPKEIFDALEEVKKRRKDNMISTMTMVDHYYLEKKQEDLFSSVPDIPTIVGFTNNDMYTLILAHITLSYARKNHCYCYYFDVNAKGDKNLAFHSSDIRYMFGTLKSSWRPYDKEDERISSVMMDCLAQFALTGNPNRENLPKWNNDGKPLCISPKEIAIRHPSRMKLLVNTFKGDPK